MSSTDYYTFFLSSNSFFPALPDANQKRDGPGSHQPDVIGQKVAEIINDGKRHNGEFIELYPIVDEGNY